MPEVLTPLPQRLDAAAREVADAREGVELALERRDALIVEAIDSGMSQRAVATAARVTVGRVGAVLAESQPDDDQ